VSAVFDEDVVRISSAPDQPITRKLDLEGLAGEAAFGDLPGRPTTDF
jgi:hypothetical protein